MNLRGVKPVGAAQMRFVQVPLVEWCLGRVVHNKLRVVNSQLSLFELIRQLAENTIQKMSNRTESSENQNLWSGSQTD